MLTEINKTCRAFLWSGKHYCAKSGVIAWEQVCKWKNAGGLGFRNIIVWNTARLGKYVWAIASKQDSVWIKWVDSVYLKGRDWWTYEPTSGASWYRKRFCMVKLDQLKQILSQNELSSMTFYSIKTVYHKLIGKQQAITWDKIVWSRLSIPKHKFILWLAI